MIELDYAIECEQNTTAIPSYETIRFLHFDKPGVREYFEKLHKKLSRSLRSIKKPPQFTSLSTLYSNRYNQQHLTMKFWV